jgi:hypothetical protein
MDEVRKNHSGSSAVELKRTRKVGYCAVLPTAPAYSWGKSKERVKGEQFPFLVRLHQQVLCKT